MTQLLHRFGLPLLLVAILASFGFAPEPSPIPRRWELEFKPGTFSMVTVNTTENGKTSAKAYFYFTYTVTNRSGQDLLFAPSFELVGDDGAVQRSGRGVSVEASKALIARLGSSLIQDQIAMIGQLQQGPENSRQGLVAWPVENFRPGTLTLYAAGFSGETAIVQKPGTSDDKNRVTLRKTRMLKFADVGELSGRGDEPFNVTEDRWIMR